MSSIADTIIYYLHIQPEPDLHEVWFFLTEEECKSEADRLGTSDPDTNKSELGEIYLNRAIEWYENQASSSCERCLVHDPMPLFKKSDPLVG